MTLNRIMSSIVAILCFSYCFTWKLIFSDATAVVHVELRFQFRSIQWQQQAVGDRGGREIYAAHSLVAVTHASRTPPASQPAQHSTLSLASLAALHSKGLLLVFTALLFPRAHTLLSLLRLTGFSPPCIFYSVAAF